MPVNELDRIVTTIIAVSTTSLSNVESIERCSNFSPYYNKINVLKSIYKIDIDYKAKQMVSENAIVMTDGKTSYRVFNSTAKKHKAVMVKDKKEVSQILP